jgi:hypothetical protein
MQGVRPASPRRLWFLVLLAALPLAGAEAPPAIRPESLAAPGSALTARATAEALPLAGIDPWAENAAVRPGDFVVALFTLRAGGRERQWLAEFRVGAPAADGHDAPARAVTVHTSTGRTFVFSSRRAEFALRMIGPFSAATAPAVESRTARFPVQVDFLGTGFDRNCAVALRLHEAKIDLPYLVSDTPFPAERATRDAAAAHAQGVTLEEERAMAGTGPALTAFLALAERTPGVKELLGEVMALPPAYRWLTGGATGFFFEPARMARLEPAAWGVAGREVYWAPFRYVLKGTLAMRGGFVFTAARRPLLACGGILALVVESPVHPPDRLELRVLAARRMPD